jgi:hypothetical protein
MNTGFRGTFVISWSQTEVDGIPAASPDTLVVGAVWRWTGTPVRVDGPQGLLLLSGAEGAIDMRQRAARMVRRLIGVAVDSRQSTEPQEDDPTLPDHAFVVTDGHRSFTVTIIDVPDTSARLLMFLDEVPPVGVDLWVVRTMIDRSVRETAAPQSGGIICFVPGTRIATPMGNRRIEDLRPGDRIQTKDDGAQEVLWSGQRTMTGARLYAMPHLRPIRFRAGALGVGRPDEDLLVSPQHRMLVKGASALALFNTPEVLVAAEDLLNDHSVTVDHVLRSVTYVHILLARHQVIFANGLETESFHPSNTALETVDPLCRDSLLGLLPEIAENPQSYGEYVRRNLSASEVAILRHDLVA